MMEPLEINPDDVLSYYNGREYFDESLCLAYLLGHSVLLSNTVHMYTGNGHGAVAVVEPDGGTHSQYLGESVCLVVNCNDTFAYASADAQEIREDELQALWELYAKDQKWGAEAWCCLKRKCRPIPDVERALVQAGIWDERFEALPPR